MHDSFCVHPQLCFIVSFELRVPGLEEGIGIDGRNIDLDAKSAGQT